MKLSQLKYFQEACKYNSISIAAENNFISQPSFSSAITKLEKELDVTLLNRNSRGVTPTEAGSAILDKINEIFFTIEEINAIAYAHSIRGNVHLATIPCLFDNILPLVLKKTNAEKLDLKVSVHCAESHEIYHQVLSGLASFGIVFDSDEIQSPEIIFTPLFEDEYVLYVGPQSPYWNADSITIQEAFEQPYIAYRDEFIKNNGGVSDIFKGMTPNIALRTDDLESIKKMIHEDNYVAFYHRFMTHDDIYVKYGLVRPLTISNYDVRTRVGYIESSKYKTTNVDRLFIEMLKAVVTDTLGQ
ncbi:MAG: LysR family transcriptional regulator [Peptococcaceae bacterium]|nr:LysR family transcriptional regulator [Peptococcaceae bacterium]